MFAIIIIIIILSCNFKQKMTAKTKCQKRLHGYLECIYHNYFNG